MWVSSTLEERRLNVDVNRRRWEVLTGRPRLLPIHPLRFRVEQLTIRGQPRRPTLNISDRHHDPMDYSTDLPRLDDGAARSPIILIFEMETPLFTEGGN